MSPQEATAASGLGKSPTRTDVKSTGACANVSPLMSARRAGYLPIEDCKLIVRPLAPKLTASRDALIGNMRTAALVSRDSSIDSFCVPYFDSPSLFARILDKDIGGHFSIAPAKDTTSKQHYLPNTAIVLTKFLGDEGVINITDYMPRPRPSLTSRNRALYPWLVRRVECVRGSVPIHMALFPAFDYARAKHATEIKPNKLGVTFTSNSLTMELLIIPHHVEDVNHPKLELVLDSHSYPRMLGPGVTSDFTLTEDQVVTFILREPLKQADEAEEIVNKNVDQILSDTSEYWAT